MAESFKNINLVEQSAHMSISIKNAIHNIQDSSVNLSAVFIYFNTIRDVFKSKQIITRYLKDTPEEEYLVKVDTFNEYLDVIEYISEVVSKKISHSFAENPPNIKTLKHRIENPDIIPSDYSPIGYNLYSWLRNNDCNGIDFDIKWKNNKMKILGLYKEINSIFIYSQTNVYEWFINSQIANNFLGSLEENRTFDYLTQLIYQENLQCYTTGNDYLADYHLANYLLNIDIFLVLVL